MTTERPHDWQVSKTFPARGRLQQHRLRAPVEFRCQRCKVEKSACLVAVIDRDWARLMCNACHGALLSSGEYRAGPLESLQRDPPQDEIVTPVSVGEPASGESSPLDANASGRVGIDDNSERVISAGVQKSARSLRRSIDDWARLIRQRIEGVELSNVDRESIDTIAGRHVMVAALRYAELIAEAEALTAGIKRLPESARAATQAANSLGAEWRTALQQAMHRHRRRHDALWGAEASLEAQVLLQVEGYVIRELAARAIKGAALRSTSSLGVPNSELWQWLAIHDPRQYDEVRLPGEVIRLRKLSRAHFIDVLRKDAQGIRANNFLVHPGVVERLKIYAADVSAGQRERRDDLAVRLTGLPSVSEEQIAGLEAAGKAYARAEMRRVMADLLVKDLWLSVASHQHEREDAYGDCLDKAALEFADKDPQVAALVAEVCIEHRVECPKSSSHRLLECVDAAVAVVEERRRNPSDAMEGSKLDTDLLSARTGPDEEAEGAWWLDDADPRQARVSWRVALYRMHLEGGWCPVPDGEGLDNWRGRRLQLHLQHDGAAQPWTAGHQVALRRRGGQWELGGVRWPRGLLPGTYVTLIWQFDRDVVTAHTAPLSEPEQVDDLRYEHQYNPQVVTRQNAPGADQDRAVPDLSDLSWVLRTLRVLGYLDTDGEAILAEDALARNCREAGMPARRLGGIREAVEKLILAKHITRVEGSVDLDGRPWHPPRPGQVRTSLLRYVPQVQAIPRPSKPYGPGDGHGNRREHWVAGFVRRLPPGASPSEQQIEAHRQAVAAAEVVDRQLLPGYTFVRPHQRNG